MGTQSQSTLVVVERGADASGLTLLGRAGRVLAQAEGESTARFVARVRAEVEGGSALQRVVLVAGPLHDFAHIAARADIARSAAQGVAAGGGGSLVLAASDVRGELAQRALGEILGEQLGAGFSGSGVRVTIARLDATSIAA